MANGFVLHTLKVRLKKLVINNRIPMLLTGQSFVWYLRNNMASSGDGEPVQYLYTPDLEDEFYQQNLMLTHPTNILRLDEGNPSTAIGNSRFEGEIDDQLEYGDEYDDDDDNNNNNNNLKDEEDDRESIEVGGVVGFVAVLLQQVAYIIVANTFKAIFCKCSC